MNECIAMISAKDSLKASPLARYFIHDEFCEIEVKEAVIHLRTFNSEVRIPFHRWDGTVQVSRGLIWGCLTFFSYENAGQKEAWVVQGLPWQACQAFAKHVIQTYEHWYGQQTARLARFVPHWVASLTELIQSDSFVSHRTFRHW